MTFKEFNAQLDARVRTGQPLSLIEFNIFTQKLVLALAYEIFVNQKEKP